MTKVTIEEVAGSTEVQKTKRNRSAELGQEAFRETSWETEFRAYADELDKQMRQARAREELLPVDDDGDDDPPASQWDDISTGHGAAGRADWSAANASENDVID